MKLACKQPSNLEWRKELPNVLLHLLHFLDHPQSKKPVSKKDQRLCWTEMKMSFRPFIPAVRWVGKLKKITWLLRILIIQMHWWNPSILKKDMITQSKTSIILISNGLALSPFPGKWQPMVISTITTWISTVLLMKFCDWSEIKMRDARPGANRWQ